VQLKYYFTPPCTSMRKIGLIILGLFLGVLILEAGLRLAGLSYLAWQDYQNSRAFNRGDSGEYRILCLGESTTAFGGEDSYPRQLERILNRRLPERRSTVINKGLPGADTSLIISELERYLNSYSPDMVIAMMGINDDDAESYLLLKNRFYRFKALIKSSRVYKLFKVLSARLCSRETFKKMYLERGDSYLELRDYEKAHSMFQEILRMDPGQAAGYIGLGRCYYEQGQHLRSKEAFLKARIRGRAKEDDYVELGWGYYDLEDNITAESMFKHAIELRPEYYHLYVEAAQFYHAIKSYIQAEEMFKKAISLKVDSKDNWPYSAFGWHYLERNMYRQAEEMFRKALDVHPSDLGVYRDWGLLKQAEGKYAQAREYFAKAQPFVEESRAKTFRNYQRLRGMVLKRGIKLVCLQYPLRSLEDLRRMFASEDRVTFVDNEMIFREALKDGSFDDYFTDRFAGDFGHCTAKGNSLLAENVAEVLIKEYFSPDYAYAAKKR